MTTEPSVSVAEKSEAKAARVSGERVTVLRINPVDGLEYYLKMVEGQPRRGRPKCNNGKLELVSPGLRHEKSGVRLNLMLNAVFDVLDISSCGCASTLDRQRQEGVFDRGVEPDMSYYIQNFERVRGLEEIDLSVSPPPDLAIEVVDTHSAKTAIGVCLALRVPEVWVYEARLDRLTIRVSVQEGDDAFAYALSETSRVLPFLRLEDIAPWAALTDEGDKEFSRRTRAWAEAELLPRFRGGR